MIKKVPALRGQTVANLFFENTVPAPRSSSPKSGFPPTSQTSVSTSSVAKGETLRDTAQNIEAMNADMIVMRHASSGAPHSCHVEGARDQRRGRNARASDAGASRRLDAAGEGTARRAERGHSGRYHSQPRRALEHPSSDRWAPRSPVRSADHASAGHRKLGVRTSTDVRAALKNADAVNVLRIQQERKVGLHSFDSRVRQILRDHAGQAPSLPRNDGLASRTDESRHRDRIRRRRHRNDLARQVSNGVAVRMAVLYLLSGEDAELKILLRGGRVIDPASKRDETADVLIDGGKITAIDRKIRDGGAADGATTLNAEGLVVAPGLWICTCTFASPARSTRRHRLRIAARPRPAASPRRVHAEHRSAARQRWHRAIIVKRASSGLCRVHPIAGITRGIEGRELTEMMLRVRPGRRLLRRRPSRGRRAVMRRALEYARMFDLPFIDHCEESRWRAGA